MAGQAQESGGPLDARQGNGGGRRFPVGLAVLLGVGLLAGLAMGILTASNPQRMLSGGRGLPTPIPDVVSEGRPAPDFTAQTADGGSITLSDLRGRPVALNFWATWCAPCRVEMPALQAASERYADDGLAILAVNAGESAEAVNEYMQELGLTFPAVLDSDGQIVDLYEVRVFPTTVWIDADGIIRAEHFGPLDDDLIDRTMGDLVQPSESAQAAP